ncbi:MAG: hypothetical protein E6J70_09570 [Deltaproteobacteria bacterium]|nr:MAG: hypothetical protein E6J70_09570 [Deltaproteobacteria bacterium]
MSRRDDGVAVVAGGTFRMRCPRCRHENRETARFCGECGASFGRGIACPRCATFNPVSQRFCDSCGQQLASTGTPERARDLRAYTPRHLIEKILTTRSALEGERKQVTVLFADMVDSMRLAERVDAEEWHRVLDRFFQILAAGIHRFEGTINQFTGDGVMALFGAPVAHEDHARRGCHAALHMMDELRGYASGLRVRGLEFSVRMGLNSGEVVVGTIGDDLRMDYTAQGHAVGLAARMEQVAAPGTVYVSEHTARLVEGFFTLRDHGTPPMKGVSTPVRVFELEGIGPLRTRLDAAGVRGFSRLVGREEELAWLDGILARALESNGQVVGVVGDAGVGKSRVCLEFVNRCRARGIAVQEAHCPAHASTVPLLPIRELLRSYFALSGGRSRTNSSPSTRASRTRCPSSWISSAFPTPMRRTSPPRATTGSAASCDVSFACAVRARPSCCCSTTRTGSIGRATRWWASWPRRCAARARCSWRTSGPSTGRPGRGVPTTISCRSLPSAGRRVASCCTTCSDRTIRSGISPISFASEPPATPSSSRRSCRRWRPPGASPDSVAPIAWRRRWRPWPSRRRCSPCSPRASIGSASRQSTCCRRRPSSASSSTSRFSKPSPGSTITTSPRR